jgi:SAM-dependent methyltransferase
MNAAHLCPVCGSKQTSEFLRRNAVPAHQNLLLASRQEAQQVTRGDLVMTVCQKCGFIFNSAFDGSKLAYGADYDNTQSHSPYFAGYMADLAKYLVGEEGVTNSRIVEVGCGKGVFLRLLVEDPAYGNSGIGFDPSYIGPKTELGGQLHFEQRFYDEACAGIPADVVVCRHVIEHVPQPLELLGAVRRALGSAPSPRIYFETPCVEWILRNRVIWDFFYEHCSLFTAFSLRTAFESAGLAVQRVRHMFGGQYLWLLAGPSKNKSREIFTNAGDIPKLCQQFARVEEQLRVDWRARIVRLADAGKVAVWGAGAKGTTLVNLVDPENKLIDCLIDLNPNKQGKFVPGTGHPIIGVETLVRRGVRTAILMNPNYRQENEALLAAAGITIQLIG